MIEYFSKLVSVDLSSFSWLVDLFYGVLIFFALKRKKVNSKDIVQDDLQSLIDYHEKTAQNLKKIKNQKKEGD